MNFFTKNLNEKNIFFSLCSIFVFWGEGEGSKVCEYSLRRIQILKMKKKIVFVFFCFCFYAWGGGGGLRGGGGGGLEQVNFFTKNPNLKIYFY